MSVRDLFEKKYSDAIENLSDDVLEIFDYLLEKCEEVEYTRDIQRKRICELERENYILKSFLSESESIEESSDELEDIICETQALQGKLAILAEIAELADSVFAKCRAVGISAERLKRQRAECESALMPFEINKLDENEDAGYYTDLSANSKPKPFEDDGECDAEDKAEAAECDIGEIEPKTDEQREVTQKDDDLSDITSRLRAMLSNDVAPKKSRDDDGYSDLARLFFASEDKNQENNPQCGIK